MGISINLDQNLVNQARIHANALSRSTPKQIEHWAKIGRIAEENPDLNYIMIHDLLLSLEDVKNGNVEE